jgi:proteic killer suppression protein
LRIRNFTHKGLKRLYAEDSVKGVPPDAADKLRKMLAFLDDMEESGGIAFASRVEGAHAERGPGHMEPQRVTRNRRLTFRIDAGEGEICDVDLEDYH